MFTTEQITQIEEMASYLMPVDEIAVLVDISEDDLLQGIQQKGSPVYTAYKKGKAKTMLEIKKQEINLAKMASPAAVENVNRYLMDMESKEL